LDPSGNKADHNPVGFLVAIDPICQSPPKSDSDCGREVYGEVG
jgi:hypothetical protein